MTITDILTDMRRHIDAGAPVAPGQPAVIDDRLAPDDLVVQGDVILRVIAAPADTATAVALPDSLRLVRDDSDGGRHYAIVSRGAPRVIIPDEWDTDSLIGPVLLLDTDDEVEIRHDGVGRHGPVTCRGPVSIRVEYQRIYDAELRIRRSQD